MAENDKISLSYPTTDDEDFQLKIYTKREYYYYKKEARPNLSNYAELAEYRKKQCRLSGELLSQQALLGNFINPDTPYRGLIVVHGTGTGKTFAGLAITEGFKQQVIRYKTFIYIITPANLKDQWKQALMIGFGKEYIKNTENQQYMTPEDREKQTKAGIANAMTVYKIMSYNTFLKRVIGERIIERHIVDNKLKVSYRKDESGEFERDIGGDIIHSLDNTIIVFDEAHNLTGGNARGEAFMKIKKNSTNLRYVFLTATPMKNLVSDIVDLVNFVRPDDSPIEYNKLFNKHTDHMLDFKEGGVEYLKKMTNGYVSYLRGADPVTFAERIEMGVKPKGLLFTRVTQCVMSDFQKLAYLDAKADVADSFDRKMGSVANMAIPILDESRKKITFTYGKSGITKLKNQLKTNQEKLNELIATQILGLKGKEAKGVEWINVTTDGGNITGAILKQQYLHHFSTKFHQCLVDINENLFDDNELGIPRSGFCYSNLVKIGIEIFMEVLKQNGYLEFDPNEGNYQIQDDTICYHCGKPYSHHHEKTKHAFHPATFLVVTGKANDTEEDVEPEDKHQYIKNIFNSADNKHGKLIKLILGSQVLTEGVNIFNTFCTYVLDVYYNFGRLDQVTGRTIRHCSHYDLMTPENPFPKVKLFKYVAVLSKNEKDLSAEEELYYKAERKFIPIKVAERAMAMNAIDCPLNRAGNVFQEEVDKYAGCIEPNDELLQTVVPEGEPLKTCPARCNFLSCDYKCENEKLNAKYYDPNRIIYKNIPKGELDYSTFTNVLARNEIEYAKKKVKELYMIGYIYKLSVIVSYVYESYDKSKRELFDDFFVQKALDELIPVTENDFNNFTDVIYDKLFKSGYLIYLDGYYIFQPFDEKENTSLYYRTTYSYKYQSNLSLQTFIEKIADKNACISGEEYNFDDVQDYYDNKPDYDIVGIIDKDTGLNEKLDTFKIREKREKFLEKKRGVGIPSLKGSVCATSKSQEYLRALSKKLKVPTKEGQARDDICKGIMNKLLDLEKYSKGANKKTYMIIPKNHPEYEFPLNLEDRVDYYKQKVLAVTGKKAKGFRENELKNGVVVLSFVLDGESEREKEEIEEMGFVLEGKKWVKELK
jgi:superfamily II DNA or RNA helicase